MSKRLQSRGSDSNERGQAKAFAIRHRISIVFISIAVCLAGWYSATQMASSVFPETNFPRCVVLIDNGVMPADEMMAAVTRPLEEAMKDIPGVVQVRSATGRGSAEINVFFDWQTDMVQSELYVLSRISQIKSDLPATAKTTVWRLTFNAFPIIGVSLTSAKRGLVELWEMARYEIKPRFLRIAGVGRVDLVGGRALEYHVVVDPLKLAAKKLALRDVTSALASENLVESTGFHTANYKFYLALVDSRATGIEDIENLVVAKREGYAVRVRDIATVQASQEPAFNVVTAQGQESVLLNVRAQPSGSNILTIASTLKDQLDGLRQTLPPDVELSFYYDQSLFVKESVASVWEAVLIGLLFAFFVLYGFMKNWGSVLTAIVVIPVSVLATVVVMFAANMTFNLMTLGGIAAAIGLIIDDAIVVVEAINARVMAGEEHYQAIRMAVSDLVHPLVGSTFTPVVVFVPLAFLDGLPGVFFRALALTMVVALLTSLVLALTLTPALASLFVRDRQEIQSAAAKHTDQQGILMRPLLSGFERVLRFALLHWWLTPIACIVILLAGIQLYGQLASDFMPDTDEGGFIIDYRTPWGTSLDETNRMLTEAEAILVAIPEVEGYSRRTGARLALALAEPNTGDVLVKLRTDRKRSTEAVKAELRRKLNSALPGVEWEFPGILGDLIGDLTWSPKPIEVKLFSTDTEWLKRTAPLVRDAISSVPGVVDTFDGLVWTGPTIRFLVRQADATRYGLTARDVATEVNIAMLGQTSTSVLEGDRVVAIRVLLEGGDTNQLSSLLALPLQSPGGVVTLGQVADVLYGVGDLELHREDLRQLVAVTGDLEGRDTGSAIAAIKATLATDVVLPPGTVEFGGLFAQQVEAFRNLLMVLFIGITLVFTVLLIEFRSFREPIAIVIGAVLALFGTIAALWLTDTSLNIVSFLGATIGVGIVAKNGILMLDLVGSSIGEGSDPIAALVFSGRRRMRPILMTSLATILAMLPMAWGIGSGADMLRPLAIGIIGAMSISMLFSLVVTPVIYHIITLALSSLQTSKRTMD